MKRIGITIYAMSFFLLFFVLFVIYASCFACLLVSSLLEEEIEIVFIFFHFLLDVNNISTQFAAVVCSCLIYSVLSFGTMHKI